METKAITPPIASYEARSKGAASTLRRALWGYVLDNIPNLAPSLAIKQERDTDGVATKVVSVTLTDATFPWKEHSAQFKAVSHGYVVAKESEEATRGRHGAAAALKGSLVGHALRAGACERKLADLPTEYGGGTVAALAARKAAEMVRLSRYGKAGEVVVRAAKEAKTTKTANHDRLSAGERKGAADVAAQAAK